MDDLAARDLESKTVVGTPGQLEAAHERVDRPAPASCAPPESRFAQLGQLDVESHLDVGQGDQGLVGRHLVGRLPQRGDELTPDARTVVGEPVGPGAGAEARRGLFGRLRGAEGRFRGRQWLGKAFVQIHDHLPSNPSSSNGHMAPGGPVQALTPTCFAQVQNSTGTTPRFPP